METSKEPLSTLVVSGLFCMVGSVAAGSSLTSIVSRFNGWQAAGYAIIAGIFISFFTLIINTMLKVLAEE